MSPDRLLRKKFHLIKGRTNLLNYSNVETTQLYLRMSDRLFGRNHNAERRTFRLIKDIFVAVLGILSLIPVSYNITGKDLSGGRVLRLRTLAEILLRPNHRYVYKGLLIFLLLLACIATTAGTSIIISCVTHSSVNSLGNSISTRALLSYTKIGPWQQLPKSESPSSGHQNIGSG